jgi:AcrR family transcriptional regulator
VSAAAQEFFKHGYGAATTALIAKRAGVSKRAIYDSFPAKADLLAAIVGRRRDAFLLAASPRRNACSLDLQRRARSFSEHVSAHSSGLPPSRHQTGL